LAALAAGMGSGVGSHLTAKSPAVFPYASVQFPESDGGACLWPLGGLSNSRTCAEAQLHTKQPTTTKQRINPLKIRSNDVLKQLLHLYKRNKIFFYIFLLNFLTRQDLSSNSKPIS
jgi:hypothetical protein